MIPPLPLARILPLISVPLLLPLAAPAQQQKLRIASEGANPPFSMINSSGEIEGFDVEIARALCQKMGVECEVAAQDWDGIIPALLPRNSDATRAALSQPQDRQ